MIANKKKLDGRSCYPRCLGVIMGCQGVIKIVQSQVFSGYVPQQVPIQLRRRQVLSIIYICVYIFIYILLICIIEMLQTKLSITHKPIRRDGFVGRSRTLLCSRLYNSYLLVCPLRNTGHLLPVSVRYRICTQS